MASKNTLGPNIDIGIDAKKRKAIADGLSRLLGGHLHAVSQDPQLSLERHRPDVQHAASDVRDAVQRAGAGGGPDRRTHPRAGLPGARQLCAVRQAVGRSRRAKTCRAQRR